MSRNRARMMSVRRSLGRRDGARCFYCRIPFADVHRATVDHFIPYSLWRTNAQINLVLACDPCNQVKADALPLCLAFLLMRGAA